MSHRSIRFRLTVWYSLALAAGLILFALATWLSMREVLSRDVSRSLSDRMQSSQAFLETELSEQNVHVPEELGEYSRGFSEGSYLKITDGNGQVIFSSNRAFPWPVTAASSSKPYRVRWDNKSYLALLEQRSFGGKPWRFAVSAPLDQTERLLDHLRLLLLTLIPMVIAVASLGGRWLSRRALKPVDEMTAAARSIGAANLSERLSVPRTGDELQRLAETWNSMLSRLEVSMKRLSRFTADASHELRTPIAVIRTTAELATRRARSAESYRDALNQIATESERMTTLLEDLLTLARVDSELVDMPQSAFNLVPVVDELCTQIRPLAEAKGLHLTFEHPDETVPVMGNSVAIRRLVLVLLDNAVKYSRDGAEVNVALHDKSSKVHLEVIDSGPGISKDELPRIFERFYRGPQAKESAHEGSGLGLSLAAGIAQKNQAEIEVSSAAGKGSTFRILFRSAA